VGDRGACAGVAHTVHELPQRCAGAGSEAVPRVPQIVEAYLRDAGLCERLGPETAVEVAVSQRSIVGSREKQAVLAVLGEVAQVGTKVLDNHVGDHDGSLASRGLGRLTVTSPGQNSHPPSWCRLPPIQSPIVAPADRDVCAVQAVRLIKEVVHEASPARYG